MSKRKLLTLTAVVAACLCICWGAMTFADPVNPAAKSAQPIAKDAAATLSSAQGAAAQPARAQPAAVKRQAYAVPPSAAEQAEKDRQLLEEKQRLDGAASAEGVKPLSPEETEALAIQQKLEALAIEQKLMEEYSGQETPADESMSPEAVGSVLTAEGVVELPNVGAPLDDSAPRDTAPGVKISQVYGNGGNSQAPTTNDYIELYNSGPPQDLTGWSVQYASSAGTTWTVTALPAITLATGQYLLVQEAVGTSVPAGQAPGLPTPQATGTIAMAGDHLKVALVSSITPIVGGMPTYAGPAPPAFTLKDFVGGGTSANWNDTAAAGGAFLAANNAPTQSTAIALYRLECGARDTDNSRNDWAVGFPAARNTLTALNLGITVIGTALPLTLKELQTARLTATPYRCATNDLGVGTTVTVDTTLIGGGPTAMLDDGIAPDEVASDGIYTVLVTVAAATPVGTKSLPVTVSDGGGLSGGSYIGIEVKPTTTPDNDNCYSATAVGALPYSTSSTFTGATVESNSISPASASMGYKRGLWYTVVGTGNTITASLCATTPALDSVMEILCGSCDGFTVITTGDDNGPACTGTAASAAWCSALGTTYYIWVSPYASGASTVAFTLGISDNSTPCTTAFPCTMCVGTPGPFTETEPGYGIATNDGCSSSPNLFTDVATPGVTPTVLRGTARGMFGTRDVDSYRFQATSTGVLTMTIDTLGTNAQAQLVSLAAGGVCPQSGSIVNTPVYVARCVSTIQTASAGVTAGTWYAIQVIGGISVQVSTAVTLFGGQMPGGTTYQYALTVSIAPAGACCKVDGTCAILTAAGCAAIPGAIYQGNDTTCSPNPCPPAGACCMYDGTCVNGQTDVYCTSLGGTWQGAATVCGLTYVRTTGGAWEDISTTGTELVGLFTTATGTLSDDDGGYNLPIGFTFNFYELPYTNVEVITNGRLDVGATIYTSGYGAVIPTAAVPNNLIAALWRDLNCTGKSVKWQLFGASPNQYLIVQYTGVVQYGTTYANTFQIVLFEGSDCIELRYLLVDPLTTGYRAGIENLTGTVGTEVTALVATGASIRLCPTTLTCPAYGACCHSDDTCSEVVQSACSAPGDNYLGAGTHCTVGLCIAPVGACCFADGHCTQLKEFFCTQQGGTSWLVGVLCDSNPCPQPDVACCYPSGVCAMMTAEACTAEGGTPGAYLSTCTPDTCPKPGACCKADQTCYMSTVVAPGDCLAGDSYRGDNTTCATPCPAPGVNCGNPIQVPLSLASLPYVQLGKTNCGFIDDYDYVPTTHCLYYYDSGEDILYQLNVTEAMDVTITLDPKTTTWAGIAIGYSCPPMDNCIAAAYSSSATPKVIGAQPNCLHLEPGTYYIMIDTWSTPDCIPVFDLKIEQCVIPAGACCNGETCTYGYQSACVPPGIFMGVDVPCAPNPCMTRACCFWPSGSCLNLTEGDCGTQGGAWDGAQTCGTKVCPTPGDNCEDSMPVTLPLQLPYSNVNKTCGRLDDYSTTCLDYYDGGEDMIYQITVTEDICVTIDMDTTTTYTGMALDSVCPLNAGLTACLYKATNSGAGGVTLNNVTLLASVGTYYLMIDTWPAPPCIPTFTLTITACPTGACCVGTSCSQQYPGACTAMGGIYQGNNAPCDPNPCLMGACCLWPSGDCQYTDEAGCTTLGGTYHGGTTCALYNCPTPGDYCAVPIVVTVPAALPYTDPNQTTCGRLDDYNTTCLGSYDGGEDIIYELIVTAPTCVTITATGNTTSNNWIGVGLDSVCPLGNPCMKTATSSGTVATMSNVPLPAGTYYVMVDTYPSPACLTDFTLTIVTSTGCPSGACCAPTGCTVTFQSACTAAGGTFGGVGSACSLLDCNNNGVDDFCDLLGGMPDCNDNGIPDACDIAGGMADVDLNGVPDVCEPDCNANNILDICEVVGGCSVGHCGTVYPRRCGRIRDCQPNGIPDVCELGGESPRLTYSIGDGTHEDSIGITAGADLAALVGYTVQPDAGKIISVSVAWGAASANGLAATVYVWSDPNQDGSPADAVVLASKATLTANIDTDTFNVVTLDAPVNVGAAGTKFFVGFIITDDLYPIGIDTTTPVSGRNWIVGSAYSTPPIDPNDLDNPAYNVPLSTTEAAGFASNLMIRADGIASGGGGTDCNGNGIPDDCDIADCHFTRAPWCVDCNENGYPDECDPDCNGNLVADECDIAQNPALDCDGNGQIDSCELAVDPTKDCNENGRLDSCDLADCTGQPWCSDCNNNGILDFCDIANCPPADIPANLWCRDCQGNNGDGIPDGCQLNMVRDVILTEGFEGGVVPPAGWTEVISDAGYNWKICTTTTGHTGTYAADVEYNPALTAQDEWLVSPAMTLNGPVTLSGWSEGSVYWGVTPYDNYDLEAWVVVGAVGGGDDILLGQIDELTWVTNWVWAPYTFTFTAPAGSFHVAFRYVGADGAQAIIDDIQIDGSGGAPGNDCNLNGIPDECDIGTTWGGYCSGPDCSSDYDGNGVPDECELCGDFTGAESGSPPDGVVDCFDYWYIHDGLGACVGNPKYTQYQLADLDNDGCITRLDYLNWTMCYSMANGHYPDECEYCATCSGDVSDDNYVDGSDVQYFVNCLVSGLNGTNCECADMDGGGVGMSDIGLFVDVLLASPGACP